MAVIYEPRGKAGEYSPLAVNLYVGCRHACAYCYCPSILRQKLRDWSANPRPRKNILRLLERDAARLAARGEGREIMFSFMSDPYQDEEAAELTRQALLVLERHGLKAHVLTKAGSLARRDFPIFARNDWAFGSTICFVSEEMRRKWEAHAPSIESRISAVMEAHDMGIRTWVSMEPVIDPEEALRVIERLRGYVDVWKVGKLNHHPKVERKVDWGEFLRQARRALEGETYYIKRDLLEAAEKRRCPAV